MARYIDADELIAEYDRVHVGPAGGARKLMVDAPTADVVPRAEVEKIFEEIDKIVIRKVTHDGKIVYDVTDKYNELKKKYLGENKDGKI